MERVLILNYDLNVLQFPLLHSNFTTIQGHSRSQSSKFVNEFYDVSVTNMRSRSRLDRLVERGLKRT